MDTGRTDPTDAASGRFSPALKFVLMVGVMSFFADFTYEAARGIVGPYLGLLGAGALAIAVISGFGELLGYGLRLVSGRSADRTGLHWPITIGGYILQMSVVPLLALAGSWQVAALLVILERVGKAIRNPPRDAMLSHAGKNMGYGWAFGVHEALDQFGAMCGPLLIAVVLAVSANDYRLAFAVLAAPAAIMLSLLGVLGCYTPAPETSSPTPMPCTPTGCPKRSGSTSPRRPWSRQDSPISRSSPTTSSVPAPCRPASSRSSTRSRWRSAAPARWCSDGCTTVSASRCSSR